MIVTSHISRRGNIFGTVFLSVCLGLGEPQEATCRAAPPVTPIAPTAPVAPIAPAVPRSSP